MERWHQTIQRELLDDHPPFVDVAAAQAAVEAWRAEYNSARPHQSLGMATPADRFVPNIVPGRPVALWVPPGLAGASPARAGSSSGDRIGAAG